MERAKRRVEEADAVAEKADNTVPVDQVEALAPVDNASSAQGSIMKKTILIVLCLLGAVAFSLSAASYADNQYQRLAKEYKAKSEKAFDEGDYDKTVEYSALAEENAELSDAYVAEMLAKYEANTRIMYARNRVLYAKNLKAETYYPMAKSDFFPFPARCARSFPRFE